MLITIPELLAATAAMYRHNFPSILRYIGISLSIWGLMALNSVVALGYFARWFGRTPAEIMTIVIQVILLSAFLVVTMAFNRLLAKHYRGDQETTLPAEITTAKTLFWKFLGVSILTGAIVFGGTLLLIIPGIIFALWYYFAPYGVMLDNLKIGESLRASKNLIAGRFGAVLWRLGVTVVLYMFVFGIMNWLIITPGKFFLFNTGSQSAYWVSIVLAILFYFFFLPIVTLTPIILYENLKRSPPKEETGNS